MLLLEQRLNRNVEVIFLFLFLNVEAEIYAYEMIFAITNHFTSKDVLLESILSENMAKNLSLNP